MYHSFIPRNYPIFSCMFFSTSFQLLFNFLTEIVLFWNKSILLYTRCCNIILRNIFDAYIFLDALPNQDLFLYINSMNPLESYVQLPSGKYVTPYMRYTPILPYLIPPNYMRNRSKCQNCLICIDVCTCKGMEGRDGVQWWWVAVGGDSFRYFIKV